MTYVAPTTLKTSAAWWRARPIEGAVTLDHQDLENRMRVMWNECVRGAGPGERVPDMYFHDVPVIFDELEYEHSRNSDRYIVASPIFMRAYNRALQRGRFGYELRKWDARKTRRQRKLGVRRCR